MNVLEDFMSIEDVEMEKLKPEPLLAEIYNGIDEEWFARCELYCM